MKQQHSLITGASGFIGRRLAARLKVLDHHLTGHGRRQAEGPWDNFLEWDLSKPSAPPELSGITSIYHLASKAHALGERVGENNAYEEIIVEGTRRLIAAAEAAGVHSFVYFSSVKAMGEGACGPDQQDAINESAATTPATPYGRAKLRAEAIVMKSKLPHVVVLRPVMVYGPGQKGNLDRMAEAIRRKRFPPLRDNKNRRSMVHVDNLIEASILLAEQPGANRKCYIIAEPQTYSTRQLYDQLRAELELSPLTWTVPTGLLRLGARFGDIAGRLSGRRMPLDSDSLQKLLGSAWYSGERITEEFGFQYRGFPLLDGR